MARIYIYSKTGKAVPVRQRRTAVAPAPAGKMVRARLDPTGGIRGAGVSVTNSVYATKRNQRTRSLGMGGVGQRGRFMDPS